MGQSKEPEHRSSSLWHPTGGQKRRRRRVNNAQRLQRRGGTYRSAFFVLIVLFFLNSVQTYSIVDDMSCHVHVLDTVRRVLS